MRSWIVVVVLALALCGASSADEIEAGEVGIPAPDAAESEPATPAAVTDLPSAPYEASDGRAAIHAWDDARGWRYGTDMIFPFTRGLDDLGITGWTVLPAGLVTVPLDLICLPTGLIAGLYGG
jgi:hypothetical protein